MNNLSTTQQIQLVTSGFSIDDVKIANSFFDIQHAEVTLMPNQSAHYIYSIGINTQPPSYTEIRGIIDYLFQIASWALLYVAMTTSIEPTPSALPTWIIATAVIVVVIVLIVALLMIKRGKR
jgi:hypothetical protein